MNVLAKMPTLKTKSSGQLRFRTSIGPKFSRPISQAVMLMVEGNRVKCNLNDRYFRGNPLNLRLEIKCPKLKFLF